MSDPKEQLVQVLHKLLDESAVVLVVNEDDEVIDYRIEPLAEVVALLSLAGYGRPLKLEALGGGVS